MNENIVVSFDIGGTNLRGAVVALEPTGPRLLDSMRRATPNYLLEPGVPAAERLDDVLGFIADYFDSARKHSPPPSPDLSSVEPRCLLYQPSGGPTANRYAPWTSPRCSPNACPAYRRS